MEVVLHMRLIDNNEEGEQAARRKWEEGAEGVDAELVARSAMTDAYAHLLLYRQLLDDDERDGRDKELPITSAQVRCERAQQAGSRHGCADHQDPADHLRVYRVRSCIPVREQA